MDQTAICKIDFRKSLPVGKSIYIVEMQPKTVRSDPFAIALYVLYTPRNCAAKITIMKSFTNNLGWFHEPGSANRNIPILLAPYKNNKITQV